MSLSISCDREVIMQDWNVVNEVMNHIEDPIYYCLALQVNRLWKECAQAWSEAFAFGPEDWERYFGDVREVPELPPSIFQTLMKLCPYWEEKRVYETHLLTLIPETVMCERDGEIVQEKLTLNTLQEMIQHPRGGGHGAAYEYYDPVKEDLGNQGIKASYWTLLTKDVIPGSQNKSFSQQQALLPQEYAVPKTLEVAAALLMHRVKRGDKLYPLELDTYTRCAEKVSQDSLRVLVGGFGSSGLILSYDSGSSYYCGVGGARKL